MEFFEPRQALEWRRKHFPREEDIICVEHHESGKLSSSHRKTVKYWPDWATGDNWRRITSETVQRFDLILSSKAKRAQKARETRAITDFVERKRASELTEAKEEAYGMPEREHSELTMRVKDEG